MLLSVWRRPGLPLAKYARGMITQAIRSECMSEMGRGDESPSSLIPKSTKYLSTYLVLNDPVE
jgi:hypothetical protein